MKKKYFISYAHESGHGNCTAIHSKFKGIEDIQKISREIEKKSDVKNVVILHFKKL